MGKRDRPLGGRPGLAALADDVRDEVLPVLLLLETTEGHLGAGDVLLGVLEVGELQQHG